MISDIQFSQRKEAFLPEVEVSIVQDGPFQQFFQWQTSDKGRNFRFYFLGREVEVAITFVHLPVWIISMEVIQEPRQIQMEIRSTAGYLTQINASEQCNF